MQGLEIVMDIDTLEVYEVIDHDQETSSDVTEKINRNHKLRFIK
ncbi:TPA: hypothetical protein ACIN0P_000732 [Streptococcus agalactiae]